MCTIVQTDAMNIVINQGWSTDNTTIFQQRSQLLKMSSECCGLSKEIHW
jgi:hypothetical protein